MTESQSFILGTSEHLTIYLRQLSFMKGHRAGVIKKTDKRWRILAGPKLTKG
jgi:hypothetical protein